MTDSKQKTILVVDDDPDILITTSSILKKHSFFPIEAKTAEEALKVLEDIYPDLILTDVLLPKMNGYEFIKIVKASPITEAIPVLVLTGRGQMKESFDLLGVSDFITKPFSVNDLVAKVNNILNIKEAALTSSAVKKILIVGKRECQDVLDDIINVVKQFGCQPDVAYTVSAGVAKTIDFIPDAFIVDVQLQGHHAAEFVNIIRHLPQHEDKPVICFSFYRVDLLNDEGHRQKLLQIAEDSQRCQEYGAVDYIGRYNHQALITSIKNNFLNNER